MHTTFFKHIWRGGFALMTACVVLSAQALTPTALIAEGDQQWAAGKLDQAQKTFEQAVAADPRSVAARMKLGGLQLSRQDFRACIGTYQQAIGLDAKNDKAWLGLGFSYLHTGQNDLSLAAFTEAVRIDPSHKDKLAPVMAKLSAP